ncbi:CbiX/SirB N-terminal domain-containing protein [Paenibacillus macerans]|uniref:sirohydrochlorin chelatase n=1 Tax=Paenibacillus macerans TaxID=44252 RepID=UPI002E1B1B5B|nr:CbiX/SirB N-terminal domain-containing protein [Paenibacillus macerans]MED4959206.1 CbiX/SirB N-terminal domain-containing protein [Paenibacillus macerans]
MKEKIWSAAGGRSAETQPLQAPPPTDSTASKPGVLVISHGSPDDHWIALVDEAVAEAAVGLPAELPVVSAFLEIVEGRQIQDGINELEAQGVTDLIVIPLFVSSGSTHIDEIAYALGVKDTPEKETDLERFRVSGRVIFGDPIDDDPLVAEMVWDKVKGLSESPDREVLLLVGHGSIHEAFLKRWERGISSLAARVGQISGLAAADYALLNPDSVRRKVGYWSEEQGYDVIVAPLFLSAGYFTKTMIPSRLNGLSYRYSGDALLPHPLLSRWMLQHILHIMGSLTI